MIRKVLSRFVWRAAVVLSLMLGVFVVSPSGASAAVNSAGMCTYKQGGSYGFTVDWSGLHNYVEFDIGRYATSNLYGQPSISPSTVPVAVRVAGGTGGVIRTTLGTSFWGVPSPGKVRFGINGNGIATFFASSSSFRIYWCQR